MSRSSALSLAALVVLLLLGLLFREDQRRSTATSFGTVAGGQRALFELFEALGIPVRRSFEPPDLLEPQAVWWLEPWDFCANADRDVEAEPPTGAGLEDFVRRGGQAVVLLRARGSLYGPRAGEKCKLIAGRALPPAHFPGEQETGVDDWARAGPPSAPARVEAQTVTGPLLSGSRLLAVPPLARFDDAGDWEPALLVDGQAFGLLARLGEGRLLVVADGSFLRNAWIDAGQGASLAVDLVRVFGAPAIDERSHGLRLEQSRSVLLVQLGALPVFLALVLLAVLLLWRRAAVPVGIPPAPVAVRPSLAEFVDSLASLYVANRDFASLAERYRELSLERIRSHLGLGPETAPTALTLRLQRQRSVPAERTALLLPGEPVQDERSWLARARALDSLVEEACR